jgi:hypothetical protein
MSRRGIPGNPLTTHAASNRKRRRAHVRCRIDNRAFTVSSTQRVQSSARDAYAPAVTVSRWAYDLSQAPGEVDRRRSRQRS